MINKEPIKCIHAIDWTYTGNLYRCDLTKNTYCISQNDYGHVKYCNAMLQCNVEKRAEAYAKSKLDELLADDPSDIRQEHVSFIDDYKLIGDK